jgi:surfactin synthase thioesterase subunit
LVLDILNRIEPYLFNSDFILLGHSMGSLVAFELCHKIHNLNLPLPKHIFIMSYSPPHYKKNYNNIHLLPNITFKKEIFKLGGTPREIIENEDLFSILEPVLRGDLKIISNYQYIEKGKLSCDLTAIWGENDTLLASQMREWADYTTKTFNMFTLQGGHFFVNEQVNQIIEIIESSILVKINTTECDI